MDTAYGLNNEGVLDFGYNVEFSDTIGTKQVYNGSESVLWNNLEHPSEIKAMYAKMRGKVDYNNLLNELITNQIDLIPESLYNYDTRYKYIAPLIEENDKTFLYIAQGSRENHLKWWLGNRLNY